MLPAGRPVGEPVLVFAELFDPVLGAGVPADGSGGAAVVAASDEEQLLHLDPVLPEAGLPGLVGEGDQPRRVATATNASVERYLRVVTTGTFSDAQFSVQVVRNLATPTF